MTITFTARTTAPLAAGTLSQNRVRAVGTRTLGSSGVTQTFTATDFAYVISGDVRIAPRRTSSVPAAAPLYPGDRFTYTVTVSNPSAATDLTDLALYDALPAGLTVVPGTTTVSLPATVGDRFGTASYANNDGTTNWTVNWAENDSGGGGAGGGRILVTGGELRLNNQDDVTTQTITRGINLTGTGATQATLTFDYRTSGTLEIQDVIVVQYRIGGAGA